MLPYLQRKDVDFPDEEQEKELMDQIYDDVNDLYQDEHHIISQGDLLEQLYSMLHELNMAARHKELVSTKRSVANEELGIMDPDKFPINRLSMDLIVELQSIWDTEQGKKMLNKVEAYVGHSL